MQITSEGREHSDLTYNSANYQWRKGAQWPDTQYYSLWHRPLLEGSRATWLTTVQITSERREYSDLTYNLQTDCGLTVIGREHSDLTHNSANYQWRKRAQRPDAQYSSLCHRPLLEGSKAITNFIQPYLHQFSIDSHGLNGYGKPLKRPFDRYQSRLEAINNGRDIRQINW